MSSFQTISNCTSDHIRIHDQQHSESDQATENGPNVPHPNKKKEKKKERICHF